MRRIADRDPAALRALYDKHVGLVYAMAMKILRNKDDADELVGDVFWELWEKSSRYDQTRASPVTYIVTLARSRCIDRTRRKAARPAVSLEAADGQFAAEGSTPADNTELGEQRELVRAALAALEPNQRQALEAAYFEGLSHSEIAEKYGKPLGTVKTYVRQGLIRLRDRLRKTD